MVLHDVKLDKSLKFINNTVKLPSKNKKKYICVVCKKNFLAPKELNKHKRTHKEQDATVKKAAPKKQAISPRKAASAKNTIKNYFSKSEKKQGSSLTHKCETCDTIFASIEEIKKHPPNKCRFVCGVCRRSYNTIYAFIVHVLQHKINLFKTVLTPDKLHKCQQCSESFGDYIDLKTHGILMHKVKSQSLTDPELESPTETNSNNREISCELCFDIFDSEEELREHMEFHEQLDDKPSAKIAEGNGGDAAENSEGLKENSNDAEDDDDTKVTAESTPRDANVELPPMPIIESSYSLAGTEPDLPPSEDSGPDYIILPPDDVIPRKQYKCKKCERVYTSIEEFDGHVDGACVIGKVCPVCFIMINSNSEWYKHITQKHRRWATCKYCFVTFNEICKLDHHKKTKHFNTFKNVCKICYKCFQTYQEFNDHLKKEHLNL